MATTQSIAREIQNCQQFFEQRRANVPNAPESQTQTLQKSFTDSVISKLNAMRTFGPSDGTQLHVALQDSPFGESNTARIISAIDLRMQNNASEPVAESSSGRSSAGSRQILKHWWNYFTQSDLDFLMDSKKSLDAKMTRVAEVGNRIGLNNPEEQSIKWSMAVLLLCCYDTMPTARQMYAKIQDFKQVWECEAKPWSLERLTMFPETPAQLPKEIYNAAYGDMPPVTATFPGINTIANLIPLRKNSKRLKTELTKTEKAEANESFQNMAKQEPNIKAEIKAEPPAEPKAKVKCEPCDDEDPEEIAIMKEAEAKIARMRATRTASASGTRPSSALVAHRNPDGCIELHPKDEPTKAAKAEIKTAIKAEVKDEPPAADLERHADVDFDDLDPWTKAAVNSLRTRNAKTAAAKNESNVSKKPAGKDEDDHDEDGDEDDSDEDNDEDDDDDRGKQLVRKRPASKSTKKRPAASKIVKKHARPRTARRSLPRSRRGNDIST